MYKRSEFTRKKYQKVKCPYCQSNSQIDSENDDFQVRICKNGHTFSYFKSIERNRKYILSECYLDKGTRYPDECDIIELVDSDILEEEVITDNKQDRVRMVYREGDRKATLI